MPPHLNSPKTSKTPTCFERLATTRPSEQPESSGDTADAASKHRHRAGGGQADAAERIRPSNGSNRSAGVNGNVEFTREISPESNHSSCWADSIAAAVYVSDADGPQRSSPLNGSSRVAGVGVADDTQQSPASQTNGQGDEDTGTWAGLRLVETLHMDDATPGESSAEPEPPRKLKRHDSFKHLSAIRPSDLEPHHQTNLPLLLLAFICVLAALCGAVVTGVHYAVIYSGCPLGLNGCNEFLDKETKGFFLIRWFSDITGGRMPEGCVHLLVSFVCALLYSSVVSVLPDRTAFEVKNGGALQSLVAVATGERILVSDALLKIVATTLYLASGGPLGGEGPAIQICTAISMAMGWICGCRSHVTQSLLASLGFVCGFAASFNAPVAGILFAMEELEHVSPSLEKSMICCILVASVVATATTRALHGDTHLFQVPWSAQADWQTVFGRDRWMLICVPIGLVCSMIGALVVLGMRALNKLRMRFAERVPYPVIFTGQAIITALVGMGVLRATGLRGIWGIGVGSLQKALQDGARFEVSDFLIFTAGKIIVMILAVTARAPGDVLEPVLIIGGFAGGGIGRLLCYSMDLPCNEVISPCVVFGMVGLFASCFRFPLTPIVIVGEITGVGSYEIILPTALAAFTAMTASSRLFRPILDEIMHEDGIDLHALADEVKSEEIIARIASSASVMSQGPQEETYTDEPECERYHSEGSHSHREGPGHTTPHGAQGAPHGAPLGARRLSNFFDIEGALHDFCVVHPPLSLSQDMPSRQPSESIVRSRISEDGVSAQSHSHGRRDSKLSSEYDLGGRSRSGSHITVDSHENREIRQETLHHWTDHIHHLHPRGASRPRTRSNSFANASNLVGGHGVRESAASVSLSSSGI